MLELEFIASLNKAAIAVVIILPLANAYYSQKLKHRTGVLWFFIALISSVGLAYMFEVHMLKNGFPESTAMLGFIAITTLINAIIFVAIFTLPNKTKAT